jgi:ABC-type Mn2+/Zn2+ transport system ATPase subunit
MAETILKVENLKGEVLTILGPNGAVKTVLLKTLLEDFSF